MFTDLNLKAFFSKLLMQSSTMFRGRLYYKYFACVDKKN